MSFSSVSGAWTTWLELVPPKHGIVEESGSPEILHMASGAEGKVSKTASNDTMDALSDFRAIVDDVDLADIYLEGNDGVRVPAIRAMLAARSDVFRKMLYGDFREAKNPVVLLEAYSGAVLRCVVEFCYSDEIDVMAEDVDSDEVTRMLVGVAAASHYLELRSLEAKILDIFATIKSLLLGDEYAPMACSMLDEAIQFGPPTKYLAEIAMCVIRTKPDLALVPPAEKTRSKCAGLFSLSAPALELVLKDEYICSPELFMFECLVTWAKGGDGDVHSEQGAEETDSCKVFPRRTERAGIAASLVPLIDLSRIAPTDLGGAVADSGLVSHELLHAAFRDQALKWERAEDFRAISASHRRNAPAATLDGSGPPPFMVAAGSGVDDVNGVYVLSSFDTKVRGAKVVWKNTNGKVAMVA
eukprot:CAMPEP_0197438194 /NCGR_PEP_ID=MMETSP1175-20131217/5260_1 /TAXON_ID=1003142 /ORGANISM="Triceratium dubium, Strain CCMP147" /LENGTH=413 /DNA_ID=CAMNT_0042967875 /DNA_START=70 /DNA_END=1307 /DNA_ORIENTATION=+